MSLLKIFQHKKGPVITAAEESFRCKHIYPGGRRCTLTIPPDRLDFCAQHGIQSQTPGVTKGRRESDVAALTAEVYGPVKSLDSATAIHHVLSNLFRLTLEDRIPQRKAAQLTTQLRALLKSLEARREEILNAKLFPQNHGALLALLALLNGDEAESSHSVVAAGLARPGSGQMVSLEETDELSDAVSRETVAPQSTAAISTAANSNSAMKLEHSVASPETREPFASRASRGMAPDSNAPISTISIPNSEQHFPSTPDVASPFPAAAKPGEASRAATNAEPDFTHSSSTEVALPTRSSQTQTNDGVCWIGPKPDQIDWARVEQEKLAYERYLRQAYPPTLNGYHRIPPDKIPLWRRRRK